MKCVAHWRIKFKKILHVDPGKGLSLLSPGASSLALSERFTSLHHSPSFRFTSRNTPNKVKEQQSLLIQIFCIYKVAEEFLVIVTKLTNFLLVRWGKWGITALILDQYRKGVMSFHLSFWHQRSSDTKTEPNEVSSDPSSYSVYRFKVGLKYLFKRALWITS